MISVLLTFLLGIAGYSCFGNGETLAGWICMIVIALVWFFHIVTLSEARAYVNCTNYWASRNQRPTAMGQIFMTNNRREPDRILCPLCGKQTYDCWTRVYGNGVYWKEYRCRACGRVFRVAE